MEESSNWKLEEIQKVETQDGDKEVVIEDSGGLKTEAESEREIVVNGNSESADENHDEDDSSSHSSGSDEGEEPKKESSQKVDSGELEEDQIVTVVDSVEPEISSPSAELNEVVEVPVEKLEALDDVAESKSKEIEGDISQSLDETNGVSADETNEDSKLIEEVILPSSDENDGSSPVERGVVSKGIEEIILPSIEDKGIEEIALSSSEEKGIEQITLPSSNENGELPPTKTVVVSKATEEKKLQTLEQNPEESSGTADWESKEKVDESLPEAANGGSVETNNAREYNPEGTGNPPIISLAQRTVRPTSWRSCCGLLDVLRRSER